MMTTLKVTRIWFEQITRIELTEPEALDVLDCSQRKLTISAKNGEKYVLFLEADTAEKLEFFEEKDGWLGPKLYKGYNARRKEEEE